MKYLITEEQNNILRVLRRGVQDYNYIKEIVVEGLDIFICQFDTFNDYYEFLCNDSAMTYLVRYFDGQHQEGYSKMVEYIMSYIKENFEEMIVMYWDDNREFC